MLLSNFDSTPDPLLVGVSPAQAVSTVSTETARVAQNLPVQEEEKGLAGELRVDLILKGLKEKGCLRARYGRDSD